MTVLWFGFFYVNTTLLRQWCNCPHSSLGGRFGVILSCIAVQHVFFTVMCVSEQTGRVPNPGCGLGVFRLGTVSQRSPEGPGAAQEGQNPAGSLRCSGEERRCPRKVS